MRKKQASKVAVVSIGMFCGVHSSAESTIMLLKVMCIESVLYIDDLPAIKFTGVREDAEAFGEGCYGVGSVSPVETNLKIAVGARLLVVGDNYLRIDANGTNVRQDRQHSEGGKASAAGAICEYLPSRYTVLEGDITDNLSNCCQWVAFLRASIPSEPNSFV